MIIIKTLIKYCQNSLTLRFYIFRDISLIWDDESGALINLQRLDDDEEVVVV